MISLFNQLVYTTSVNKQTLLCFPINHHYHQRRDFVFLAPIVKPRFSLLLFTGFPVCCNQFLSCFKSDNEKAFSAMFFGSREATLMICRRFKWKIEWKNFSQSVVRQFYVLIGLRWAGLDAKGSSPHPSACEGQGRDEPLHFPSLFVALRRHREGERTRQCYRARPFSFTYRLWTSRRRGKRKKEAGSGLCVRVRGESVFYASRLIDSFEFCCFSVYFYCTPTPYTRIYSLLLLLFQPSVLIHSQLRPRIVTVSRSPSFGKKHRKNREHRSWSYFPRSIW